MSRVSVCITCHNESAFVEEAVRSVLRQTAADHIEQIIIVDDGSTDGSPEKLQRLADETGRILLITQENRGLPVARNRAMREATGDLIAFLDGDDIWAPSKIEKQIAAFADPIVGLVYSDYVDFLDKRLDQGMLVCVRRLRGHGPSLAKDYYLRGAPIMPSTAAIRQEVSGANRRVRRGFSGRRGHGLLDADHARGIWCPPHAGRACVQASA